MPFSFSNESIFDCGADILVNPVNCLGISGAGLAKEFALRFPDAQKKFVDACRNGYVVIGRPYFECTMDATHIIRICYFPTKHHFRDRSMLPWIRYGLHKLRDYAVEHAEEYYTSCHPITLAIPAIGCGLGGLDFDSVWEEIESALSDVSSLLNIIIFPPKGKIFEG